MTEIKGQIEKLSSEEKRDVYELKDEKVNLGNEIAQKSQGRPSQTIIEGMENSQRPLKWIL